jgi:hypothetical protein
MKILKKRGEEETKSMPHAPVNNSGKIPIFTLFLHGKAVKNDQSLACENKLVINIKKTRITVISTFPNRFF